MKTVFLTGISGFLGAHIARQLLRENYRVKGLIRNQSAYTGERHINLTLVEGDLFSDLMHPMSGVDVVIHAAAETRQYLLHPKDYFRVNLDATVLLFQTALHCHVKQFIFISTANTLGYGTQMQPGEESLPIKHPFDGSPYASSKLSAENFLLDTDHPIHVAIVNPTFMIGAFGDKPSSCKIILKGWKKRIVFYPPGGKNFVHVKDVAKAVVQLTKTIKFRQKLLIAGENLTYREFFKKITWLSNQHSVLIKVPRPVLRVLGYLGDGLRCFGIPTSIHSLNMNILSVNSFYSNRKSIQELGLHYNSIDEAIVEALEHLNNKNL